jgi:hypothetical protein
VQHGKNNVVKRNTNVVNNNRNGTPFESKKYAYRSGYKGKNPMTRTQWRRYQKTKIGTATNLENQTLDIEFNLEWMDSLTLGNDKDDHHT